MPPPVNSGLKGPAGRWPTVAGAAPYPFMLWLWLWLWLLLMPAPLLWLGAECMPAEAGAAEPAMRLLVADGAAHICACCCC